MIYLDNHTVTRPSEAVYKGMLPFLRDCWGVTTSPFVLNRELFPALDQAYDSLYQLFEASEKDTVIFTSSGTEAVNHVILATYLDVTRQTGKNHFITSQIDEASTILAMERLQQLGCVVRMANVNKQGKVTAKEISEAISPRTALVSLSWACGITGTIHDIAEIASICRLRGVLLHLDISHFVGKAFLDVQEIQPDFMTLSGELIHGPQGSGALFIRSGLSLSPLICGSREQGGYRCGNFSVANLVGLGIAADETLQYRDVLCTEIARLRNYFEEGILKQIPDAIIFFHDQQRLPNCSVISFPGIVSDALLFALHKKSVFACFGGGNFQKISAILEASGIEASLANTALNFSLSRETTEEEINKAITIISETRKRFYE